MFKSTVNNHKKKKKKKTQPQPYKSLVLFILVKKEVWNYFH
jgi:hypothetical protein